MLTYQQIDGQLRKLQAELSQLPERKKASELTNQLKSGQSRLAVVEQNAQKVKENCEKVKAYYDDLFLKVETLSKSTSEADLEKVRDLQHVKNTFSNMIEKLEKELTKITAQTTMINNEYNSIIKNAMAAKSQLDAVKVKFAEQKQKLEPQIAKLQADLDSQAKKIDKAVLDRYYAKRENKFPVFVQAINGTCGGCRMAISASKMREFESSQYVECENCGRIIIKK